MLEDRYYMRQPSFQSRRSVTLILLILNAVVFITQLAVDRYTRFPLNDYFALSLYGLKHGWVWQLLTFQFLHGGWIHILVNLWVIWMFGRELEENLGKKAFLALYLGSGILGGLVQAAAGLAFPGFAGATLGASAGAFGLVAAYATLYPERPLTLLLFFILPVAMRAKFLLLFSGIIAILGILFPAGNVANAAHLGGMVGGILFVRYAMHWNFQWPQFRRPRSRRRLVKVPSQDSGWWKGKPAAEPEELGPEEFVSREVDPILDKISAHGIQSLTDRERRILEAARAKMAKR
jgi:membrane associated rhomboid family serine protease